MNSIEPALKNSNQFRIQNLVNKLHVDPHSSASKYLKDEKTQISTENNEIHVNIGRIDVQGTHKNTPIPKAPVRGFENYLLSRMYFDRHYF